MPEPLLSSLKKGNIWTWVCSTFIVEITGLNPARVMEVCRLCMLCVVRYSFLRRVGHLYKRVLLTELYLSVIEETHRDLSPLGMSTSEQTHVRRFSEFSRCSFYYK
jgi:hypothetical protein